jgi:hypothetical protein
MFKKKCVAIFTLFISSLCLWKSTFTFDVAAYMNEKKKETHRSDSF